ncbi:uncharacterized protein LOC135693756 isoform X2 [Rhopilema esculentum]|uniref:uncharacterized protein LOC135693756 isoform X2 n=1 Tax=Rhopilema esculentum TaxID=499914 RepID=UPI0031D015D0
MKGVQLLVLLIAASAICPLFGAEENNKKPESKRVDSTKTSGDIKKALDDELEFEADVQELEDKNDQPACTNTNEKKCLDNLISCTTPAIRKFCPRTCLVCCADFSESFCKKRKRACHVKFAKERMRHYCPKTCEYCGKAPAPPPCLSTQFGCCWDKSTPASAPIGSGRENCPPCKDKQSESFCNMFKGDCTDYHPERIKGRQIRSFCPKTCRMCGKHPQCVDHPKQQYNCPQFKADGLCKANEKHMRLWCPKTCGFCKPCNDNPAVNCAYLNKRRACTLERVRVLCPYTCDACG